MTTSFQRKTALSILVAVACLVQSGGATAGSCCGTDIEVKRTLANGFSALLAALKFINVSTIHANGDIADSVAIVDTTRTQTQETVRAIPEYEMPPSAILSAGASEGARLAKVGSERAASVYSSLLLDRIANASTQRSPTSSLLDAYQDYSKNYDPRRGSSNNMANADINAESLLSGAGKPGKTNDHTFSKEQIAAAQRFIMNAVNLTPLPVLDPSREKTEAGRRYTALARVELAKGALAQKSFVDALAWKTPIEGLAQQVGKMWQAMGKAIVPNGSLPDQLSMEGFLTGEVERRYANPSWYVAVAAASPAAMQREALYMQAIDLRLKLVQIEQMRKVELLLAQQLANALPASPGRTEAALIVKEIAQ